MLSRELEGWGHVCVTNSLYGTEQVGPGPTISHSSMSGWDPARAESLCPPPSIQVCGCCGQRGRGSFNGIERDGPWQGDHRGITGIKPFLSTRPLTPSIRRSRRGGIPEKWQGGSQVTS